jgi:hypothetical protein
MSYDENAGFDDANPPEESSNRTFLLAAGILGGLVYSGFSVLAPIFSCGILPPNRQKQRLRFNSLNNR